ncbi:hypothetical protein K438DRAFT_1443719, partial [Mycena galopus ATCC 62051]
ALIKKFSTPALFLTINPADIADPLLAAIAGVDPGKWRAMSSTDRQVFVAKNPGAAAVFFDEVIKAFIRIILKGDTPKSNGLF